MLKLSYKDFMKDIQYMFIDSKEKMDIMVKQMKKTQKRKGNYKIIQGKL